MTSGFAAGLFDGRVALITGAARGIGAATATALASLGATIAICDRRADDLGEQTNALSSSGVDVLSSVTDVRDTDAVAAFVEAVLDRFGRVDVLVNNAGGSFSAPFLETTVSGERMLIAENFTQVTDFVRRCVPAMPPGSSIVNITSIEAVQAAPGFAVYAAMKAALTNLTRTLALELAPTRHSRERCRARCARDQRRGSRSRRVLSDGGPYRPATDPPIGRLGTPEEGADAVAFLASPLAAFVTGVTLHVDGGTWAAGGWHRS